MSNAIPQIIAKINTDTLCGGTAAKTGSFISVPSLFSIWLKKSGMVKTTETIITVPMIISRRL